MTKLYEMPVTSGSSITKKRVAIYARVSKVIEEQETSYDLQIKELIKLISLDPAYELICVFADKDSGTSADRVSFQKLLELARLGGLDLIYTKSISRFGRNTADVVTAIRELRAIGVEIVFDKEGISTDDPRCDFMLEILSAHATEESQQISSNVRWINEKNNLAGRNKTWKCYGYKIEGNSYTVVPEEAAVIRQIYDWYLAGVSFREMIQLLHQKNIPSITGKEYWYHSTLESIISNEKYVGDLLLQKTVESKPLGIKRQKNRNSNQYYVRDHHVPIIGRHDYAQATQLRESKRLNHKPRELAMLLPHTYYFYSVQARKHFVYRVETAKGINLPVLLLQTADQRKTFRYSLIENVIVSCAQYLLDNQSSVKNTMVARIACVLSDIKARLNSLYSNLQKVDFLDIVGVYTEIADLLIAQHKIGNVSKVLYRIRQLANKVVLDKNIDDIKQLFNSVIFDGNAMHLIIASDGKKQTTLPTDENIIHHGMVPFTEKYKPAELKYFLSIV